MNLRLTGPDLRDASCAGNLHPQNIWVDLTPRPAGHAQVLLVELDEARVAAVVAEHAAVEPVAPNDAMTFMESKPAAPARLHKPFNPVGVATTPPTAPLASMQLPSSQAATNGPSPAATPAPTQQQPPSTLPTPQPQAPACMESKGALDATPTSAPVEEEASGGTPAQAVPREDSENKERTYEEILASIALGPKAAAKKMAKEAGLPTKPAKPAKNPRRVWRAIPAMHVSIAHADAPFTARTLAPRSSAHGHGCTPTRRCFTPFMPSRARGMSSLAPARTRGPDGRRGSPVGSPPDCACVPTARSRWRRGLGARRRWRRT